MESLSGKLQRRVDQLEKKVVHLQDRNGELKNQNNLLKLQNNKLKKENEQLKNEINNLVEEKIKEAVAKVTKEITEHYEKEIKKRDQRIFELETRLNINSDTSSLPSSKNPISYKSQICNSRKESDKPKGGQKGHKKNILPMFEEDEITDTKIHELKKCPHCGSKDYQVQETKIRDELDFKIIVTKTRHKFPVCKCDKCNKIFQETIPAELHAENQYGKNVKTMAVVLTIYGFVAYNRIRKIMYGLSGGEINPSEGYLVKLQKKASEQLNNFTFDVKETLLHSDLMYWDDTVITIGDKDRACLRVYTNGNVVLYKAHLAKNSKGMDEDGILQNLPSTCTVMHDHLLHNYCDDYQYKNVECNAHIARKLKGITVNTNHKWSDEMQNLLEKTLEKRKEYAEKNIQSFTTDEIKSFDEEYDAILEKGFKEYQEFSHLYEYEKEENLLEFMRDYKGPITEWIRDFSIPYSNNLCETLLRMLKAKMKISYMFHNLASAEYHANIITYTETCGRFGVNKYQAIERLFDGNPYSVQELLDLNKTTENA